MTFNYLLTFLRLQPIMRDSAVAGLTERRVSQEVKKKKDPAPLRSADLLNHAAAWEMFNLTNWFLFPLLFFFFLFFHAAGILSMEVMSSSHPFKSDCGPYILRGRWRSRT